VNRPRRSELAVLLLGALAIVIGSAALGMVVNHLSPRGVPLLAEYSETELTLSLPPGISGLTLEEVRVEHEFGSTLFLDARAPEEYEEGHIPGALSLPAYEFEEYFLDLMDVVEEADSIVVYCAGGECADGIELAERLLEAGRTDIQLFEKGWRAWREAGDPVREGPDP
jgi:rhodanese-related sulfurtransferase